MWLKEAETFIIGDRVKKLFNVRLVLHLLMNGM